MGSRSILLPTASALRQMAILFAIIREAFPRFFLGRAVIPGNLNIRPCFGGGVPEDTCLKSAFSAPRTWMVLDGKLPSLLTLPAIRSISAHMSSPAISDALGRITLISFLTNSFSLALRSQRFFPSFSIPESIPDVSPSGASSLNSLHGSIETGSIEKKIPNPMSFS